LTSFPFQGLISPNFVHTARSFLPCAQSLAEHLTFIHFHQNSASNCDDEICLICEVKFAKLMRCLPNLFTLKKLLVLFVQKGWAKMLLKSTQFDPCELQGSISTTFHGHILHLLSGLNFINVLCTALMRADPKSIKKTVKLSIFFKLSGSTGIKAARKMLLKLTPGLHFLT